MKLLVAVIVTALGYGLFGVASSVLAIPPGFASPIWPAAGVGLLAVTLWGRTAAVGVFVASFLLNMSFASASLAQFSVAWLTSAAIALGAVFQVLLANYLIARFTNFPDLVSRAGDAILLGVLSGPVACLMSASLGVFSLWGSNLISSDAYLHNWVNWWVGDSIGVMFFAPIILLTNIGRHHDKKPKLIGFLLLYFVLTGVAVGVFLYAKEKEHQNTLDVFSERANGFFISIEKQLDSAVDTSQSLVAVFEAFPLVDYESFSHYARSLYVHIPGTQALSWIPIVGNSDRAFVESQLIALGGLTPYLFKKGRGGENISVEVKNSYFPVLYIYPQNTNRAAIGFDLSSSDARNRALLTAITTKKKVATEPIELLQETESQHAFLLFSPVLSHSSLSSPSPEVQGLVSVVYRIEDLILAALGAQTLQNYNVSIYDITDGDSAPLIDKGVIVSSYSVEFELQFAERLWRIVIDPTKTIIYKNKSNALWFILIFSFFIVTLLGLLVLLILSRAAAIEHEVDIKTVALEKALADAKHLSQVKSSFLATMSHELRTPLNSIIGFSRRLQKGLENSLDEKYLLAINSIQRNGIVLLEMINDVLDLSKVEAGKMTINKAEISVDSIVNRVVEALIPLAESVGTHLSVQPSPVPRLYVDEQRFRQILTNLIHNAIKFTLNGDVGVYFMVKPYDGVDGLEIEVRDSGKGISTQDQQRLFLRYEQLGDTFQGGQMGTGLGLALVRDLVELHDGTVRVESAPREGASFFVWLPFNK